MTTFDTIIDELEKNKTMNANSKKIYISRIKVLKKTFKRPSDLENVNTLLKGLEESSLNTRLSYINTIIALKRYSNAFNIDEDGYKKKQYQLINEREEKLTDDIQNKSVVPWEKLVEIREKYANADYGGLEHLITSLYTLIPPLRDDFGDVEFITDSKADNDKNNYYNLKTKTFIMNHYKGSEKIKNIKKRKKQIKFPDTLDTIIKDSLGFNPRIYMITKNKLKNTDELYTNFALSGIVKEIFGGISINQIRHSFASKDFVGKGINIKDLKSDAAAMQHSLETHLTYFRGIST